MNPLLIRIAAMDAAEDRLAKLERFRAAGLDPYPAGATIGSHQPVAWTTW